MGDPQPAKPGTQNVQTDNIKEKSWVDVHKNDGPIGQIFYVTDKADLDRRDLDLLDLVVKEYSVDMGLNPKNDYPFFFRGYADHRATKEHNDELSALRANNVRDYLGAHLSPFTNYKPQAQGMGVDLNSRGRPPDSKTLGVYRRVDIIAPALRGVPPEPTPPPPPAAKKVLRSENWKARMKSASSASATIFTGDRFFLDIVDTDNGLIYELRYVGLGFGLSPAPVGATYSPSPTPWLVFYTNQSVRIEDFEGFAFHTSLQAQASGGSGTGGTADVVIMTLAHCKDKPSPNWVTLTFHSFTIVDPNFGLGASQTVGTLEPTAEYGGPRSWLPTDP